MATHTQSPPPETGVRSGPIIGLLAGAHFSHHVLTAIIVPLLPFIRDEFGLSYAQSGLVTSAFALSYGFSQLPAGWIADRIGPRYLLLIGITGVSIAGAFVGVAGGYGAVMVGLVMMGIAGGGYHPSSSAVIANLVHPNRRGRALGFHIIGGSSSFFLAPLLAAGIVTVVGWRGTFLTLSAPVAILGIAVFVLVGRFVRFTREQVDDHPPRPRRSRGDVRGSADSATPRPPSESRGRYSAAHMVFFLVLTGVLGAGIGSVIPYIPLYLVDARGVDERLAGSAVSIIFAAGFFAAPLGGMVSDRIGRVRVMVVTGVLTGPAIALLVIAPVPFALSVSLLVVGILMFFRMPTSESHIIAEVAPRRRSTILGIYFFASSETGAVLTPILGATIDRWGFTVGIVAMGVLVCVFTAVCGTAMFALSRQAVVRAAVQDRDR